MNIGFLKQEHLDSFYDLFTTVMTTEFTEFREEEINLFINVLHKKENFFNPEHMRAYNSITAIDDNDDVVGFIVALKSITGVAILSWIGVNASCRGKGIGSDLLNFYEKLVQGQGNHLIELNTIRGKEKFYIKNKYYEIGERKDGYYHIDNVIMNKRVS